MTVPSPNKTASALESLATIPKVGSSFGFGTDWGLGTSHTHALKIAHDVLREISKNEFEKIANIILIMFDEWREAYGVYPPRPLGLGLLGSFGVNEKSNKQVPAKEYCDRIIQKEIEGAPTIDLPAAWECCNEASNPIELFEKLLADEYEPASKVLEENWDYYPAIMAILILLTDNQQEEYKTSDCIRTALKIASFKMRTQSKKIKDLEPSKKMEEKRKLRLKEVQNTKKENGRKKVINAYQKLSEGTVPFNSKRISEISGVSPPMVSRYLRELGINIKKK